MAKRSVRNDEVEIDPLFFVPDGVGDLHYKDESAAEFLFEGEIGDTGLDVDLGDDTGEGVDYEDDPDTPSILDIFSQTSRKTPNGTEVIDVVFDAEDIAGFTNYELRVSKI